MNRYKNFNDWIAAARREVGQLPVPVRVMVRFWVEGRTGFEVQSEQQIKAGAKRVPFRPEFFRDLRETGPDGIRVPGGTGGLVSREQAIVEAVTWVAPEWIAENPPPEGWK